MSPLEKKLQASIVSVDRAKAEAAVKNAAKAAEAENDTPAPSRLAVALCAAVDAAGTAALHAKQSWGITLAFNEEQIKCLAITAYIQNGRSSQ
jgi:hypothetical protein